MTKQFSLTKKERINSKKQIDHLFNGGGSRAMSAFPLRMVYMLDERGDESEASVQMMVSVPKRYFKHAVKRNHIKRQVREAYRLGKAVVVDALETTPHEMVSLCFIWTDDKLRTSEEVARKVQGLLIRLAERVAAGNKLDDMESDTRPSQNSQP